MGSHWFFPIFFRTVFATKRSRKRNALFVCPTDEEREDFDINRIGDKMDATVDPKSVETAGMTGHHAVA